MSQTSAPLTPYLEDATSRVLEANDLTGEFELTCSLPVERMNIDEHGVTLSGFARFTDADIDDRARHLRLINQHPVEASDDVTLVWSRSGALARGTHTAWVMTDGDAVEYPHPLAGSDSPSDVDTIRLPTDVYVYERLPFNGPVTSREDLRTQLETVLSDFAGDTIAIDL